MIGSWKRVVVGAAAAVVATVALSGCSGEYTECGRVDGTYVDKTNSDFGCQLACVYEGKGYTKYFWCDKDKKCICD